MSDKEDAGKFRLMQAEKILALFKEANGRPAATDGGAGKVGKFSGRESCSCL
jgi:hypothetical protein